MSLKIYDVVAIVIFSLLFIFIISSTIYDVIARTKTYERNKLFTVFSLFTNGRDLLKLEPETSDSIRCFDGLRALSAFWVVAGHRISRIYLMVSEPFENDSWFGKLIYKILRTNAYAVDVFFVIGGVLITQSCLKSLDAKNFYLLKIYVRRYVRYVPTFAVLLIFVMSSCPTILVDNKNMGYVEPHVENCRKYWWSSLLLIQNYVNPDNLCQSATWYLSTDFQLILISPLFIFLLWKLKYKAFWLFGVIILFTQTGIFFARYYDTIPVTSIYQQTHFRMAQFLVGISLGYIMYEREGKNYMRRRSKLIGWVVSLTVFVVIKIYFRMNENGRFPKAFHRCVHRIAWAGLVSWTIFVCHHLKSGGIVNWCLSHPLWQPIARISLSIYLIHNLYIILSIANMEALRQINFPWIIHIIFGDIWIAIVLGALLYLVIEAPSNKLWHVIMEHSLARSTEMIPLGERGNSAKLCPESAAGADGLLPPR